MRAVDNLKLVWGLKYHDQFQRDFGDASLIIPQVPYLTLVDVASEYVLRFDNNYFSEEVKAAFKAKAETMTMGMGSLADSGGIAATGADGASGIEGAGASGGSVVDPMAALMSKFLNLQEGDRAHLFKSVTSTGGA